MWYFLLCALDFGFLTVDFRFRIRILDWTSDFELQSPNFGFCVAAKPQSEACLNVVLTQTRLRADRWWPPDLNIINLHTVALSTIPMIWRQAFGSTSLHANPNSTYSK